MEVVFASKDTSWTVFALPAFVGTKTFFCDSLFFLSLLITILMLGLLAWVLSTAGIAWRNGRNQRGRVPIPGPRGLPIFGSLFALRGGLAHRTLAAMARRQAATELMALSLGSTPVVVASDPQTAKEILTSPHFADRPLKQSARDLMFSRAIGFAPSGTYWRLLRRIASSHLFAPRRILAHEAQRQQECTAMLAALAGEQAALGMVGLRKHLQIAALNSIMGCVFGRRYENTNSDGEGEAREVREMVREGFDLLGAFNFSDYLPWMSWLYDPNRIARRCEDLVPRVRRLVKGIIDEHKGGGNGKAVDGADFVDVLLGLEGEEKLDEDDMIAVLWEMIFRGTDTTAHLTEWAMAELILNQDIQAKLQEEVDRIVGRQSSITDADVANMPYLKAVVKETLRVHPPGPLLSWARLSTSDVQLSNGMLVPDQTTAMVNMWAITHDSRLWREPYRFGPERFLSGADVDVRGGDLRLAPFGAGRRVCPGRELGLVTVHLWVAKLVHHFEWVPHPGNPVDLDEVLKLSCEMRSPLSAVAIARNVGVPF